ncbi:MAG: hypothetical protein ABI615_14105 [Chthoniobacterales bacterium]
MDDAPPDAILANAISKAKLRWRFERLLAAVSWISLIGGAALLLIAGIIFAQPKFILWFPYCIGAVLIFVFLALLVVWMWPIKESAVWKRLDQCGDLKDGVLSAQEFKSEKTPHKWSDIQHRKITAEVNWQKARAAWPLRLSREAWMTVFLFALLCGFLGYRYRTYTPPIEEIIAAQRIKEQSKALDQILKDWEQAQKEKPSESLKKAIEELKPLQERLAKGDMNDKKLMMELSRVETKLQAMRDAMKAETISAAMAQELAEALQEMEGTSGLAAALQRNDLAAAQQKASETAKAWDKPGAKALDAPLSEKAQKQLSSLAARSESQKNNEMASAMRQLSSAGRNNDSKQMSQAMKQMQNALEKQSNCQSCQQCLSLQMKQLSACKNCMGDGKNPGASISLIPSLTMSQKKGGKGAGSESNPNLMGAETALNGDRTQEKIKGVAGEGDSDVTTEKTTTPNVAGISAATAAQFQDYEKLSQVAIQDENLPLAHREAIKRYFENIHPHDK